MRNDEQQGSLCRITVLLGTTTLCLLTGGILATTTGFNEQLLPPPPLCINNVPLDGTWHSPRSLYVGTLSLAVCAVLILCGWEVLNPHICRILAVAYILLGVYVMMGTFLWARDDDADSRLWVSRAFAFVGALLLFLHGFYHLLATA